MIFKNLTEGVSKLQRVLKLLKLPHEHRWYKISIGQYIVSQEEEMYRVTTGAKYRRLYRNMRALRADPPPLT